MRLRISRSDGTTAVPNPSVPDCPSIWTPSSPFLVLIDCAIKKKWKKLGVESLLSHDNIEATQSSLVCEMEADQEEKCIFILKTTEVSETEKREKDDTVAHHSGLQLNAYRLGRKRGRVTHNGLSLCGIETQGTLIDSVRLLRCVSPVKTVSKQSDLSLVGWDPLCKDAFPKRAVHLSGNSSTSLIMDVWRLTPVTHLQPRILTDPIASGSIRVVQLGSPQRATEMDRQRSLYLATKLVECSMDSNFVSNKSLEQSQPGRSCVSHTLDVTSPFGIYKCLHNEDTMKTSSSTCDLPCQCSSAFLQNLFEGLHGPSVNREPSTWPSSSWIPLPSFMSVHVPEDCATHVASRTREYMVEIGFDHSMAQGGGGGSRTNQLV